MIGDDNIHAARVGVLNRFVGGDARVAGDEEFDSAIENRGQRFDMNAVTLLAANGDVIHDIRFEGLERLHKQSSGGLSVHVKVAPDADFIFLFKMMLDDLYGCFNVRKRRGRSLFGMKERAGGFGCGDAASDESLLEEERQVEVRE